MPLTVKFDNEKTIVNAVVSRPLVYFDTWAMKLLLTDRVFGGEFLGIMTTGTGTLAISVANISEIFRRSDRTQIAGIINCLGNFDLAFFDVNPHDVIERERKNRVKNLTEYEQAPWLDDAFIKPLVARKRDILTSYHRLKPHDILKWLFDESQTTDIESDGYDSVLLPIVEQARANSTIVDHAKKRLADSQGRFRGKRPHTAALDAYIRDRIVASDMGMPNKEWNDALHTIVPVSYCDFVLIDSRWHTLIEQTGLKFPEIAYIHKPGQETVFLDALREFAHNIAALQASNT